ncbi:hypothetical protein, partial [Helicobacter pullorum]|uniref:hypothetical protein n=1 Tax=Helicobacter pullorum TaxID=35818 RepID=UPI001A9304C6
PILSIFRFCFVGNRIYSKRICNNRIYSNKSSVVCRVLVAMSANPFVRICFVIAWLLLVCLAKG